MQSPELSPDALLASITEFGIFSQDPQGTIRTWNPGAERIFQYGPADAVGRNIADLFVPEDQDRDDPRREMAQATEQGNASDDRWHQRRDGTRFWASGVLMPVRDEAGGVLGFVKVVRDFTLGKHLEEQLRLAEEEYSRVFMRNPAAITMQRAESRRILLANEEFLRLTGYWRSEVIGHAPGDLRLWSTESDIESRWFQARDTDDSRGAVFDLRPKMGGTKRCVAAFRRVAVHDEIMVVGTYLPL